MTRAENQESYVFDQSASAEQAEYLTGQLVAFNQRHSTALPIEHPDALPLQLFVLDRAGAVLGGVLGRTHAIPGWFEISVIWIEERLRQHGLGRRLMEQAEHIASERGCQYARLTTSNFQAPLFYQKLGYQPYGALDTRNGCN